MVCPTSRKLKYILLMTRYIFLLPFSSSFSPFVGRLPFANRQPRWWCGVWCAKVDIDSDGRQPLCFYASNCNCKLNVFTVGDWYDVLELHFYIYFSFCCLVRTITVLYYYLWWTNTISRRIWLYINGYFFFFSKIMHHNQFGHNTCLWMIVIVIC